VSSSHVLAKQRQRLLGVALELRILAFRRVSLEQGDRFLVRIEAEALQERIVPIGCARAGKLGDHVSMPTCRRCRQAHPARRHDASKLVRATAMLAHDSLRVLAHVRIAGRFEDEPRTFDRGDAARRSKPCECLVDRLHRTRDRGGRDYGVGLLRVRRGGQSAA
jgi:hypothetical protein